MKYAPFIHYYESEIYKNKIDYYTNLEIYNDDFEAYGYKKNEINF
ncbi:hypothetical protein IC3_00264 [Bacillus cereus VD142]|nr:hypothetical protein IC3_00264 [Bacillus cereus VD142]